MSEINVISRTQQIIVDIPTQSVAVVNGAPKGSLPTAGIPVVSGLSHRGTLNTSVPAGGASNVYLNPTVGLVKKVGTDVEIVDAGANTFQMRVKVEGLYHISAHARCDGNGPPMGAILAIHVNGFAITRSLFHPTGYASVSLADNVYLDRDATVNLYAYGPGPNGFIIAACEVNNLDPYSPILSVWRVSTVNLV